MKHFFIYSVSVAVIFSACSKSEAPVDQPVDGIHFSCTIDEVEESFKNGIGGWATVTDYDVIETGAPNEVFQYVMFANTDATKSIYYIGLLDTFYSGPTAAQLAARWHEGTYAFGKRADYNGGVTKPGALIQRLDPTDTIWYATDFGWQLQTGALHVNDLEEINDQNDAAFMASMVSSFKLYYHPDSSSLNYTDVTIKARVSPEF
jgi:hypothetical protein